MVVAVNALYQRAGQAGFDQRVFGCDVSGGALLSGFDRGGADRDRSSGDEGVSAGGVIHVDKKQKCKL
jgi:hypothetical protein